MRIAIKVIDENNAYGVVVESWIKCQLPSGREIEIFDYQYFNLKQYEGMIVDCLVLLKEHEVFLEGESDDPEVLWGTYTTEFDYSEDFPKTYERLTERSGLITKDSTFLVRQKRLEKKGVKNRDRIGVNVGGYVLLDWYKK